MTKEKQKIGYAWNEDVYCDRTYTAPDGTKYSLEHLRNQTYSYSYKFRDEVGKRQKGKIDIEVRYDPHCFTHERKDGETTPTLSFDKFDDGSTVDRVFDLERYNNCSQLVQSIQYLSRKNCKESRVIGKALYFKQQNRQKPRFGLYVILKVRNEGGKLVMFVETAHNRNNEPYKLALSDKEETYDIILGRLIQSQWPELLVE
ncbi:TPA: hypothetical protein NGS02_004741 [Vibrio parahaemolyticus]|uniref:hypothetical protein n=1 Tax=Vibrio TaxID=662 RepID=UPI0006E43082|nr:MULTISPECIES: hypothetical protein [Vibrio]KQH88303.1 hypothetical protein AMR75_18710 [Vibrio fluvialis]MCS0049084.1 hypothetical protein [Vibrio parahaemolyticus]HCE4595097.1 hypothetical protein [Vibrio parahaemolyticus]HCG5930200.1 hypothetical protein [Vibrio parahaemolyticus]HCM1039073.1 hypothetical protein [Vibrio parahaemolyticus]